MIVFVTTGGHAQLTKCYVLKCSNINVQDDTKDEENQQPVQLSNAHNKSQQFVEKPENVK